MPVCNNPVSPILTVSTLSLNRRWSKTSSTLYERIVGFEYIALINATSPLPKTKLQSADFRSGPDSTLISASDGMTSNTPDINQRNNNIESVDEQNGFFDNLEKSLNILHGINCSSVSSAYVQNDLRKTSNDASSGHLPSTLHEQKGRGERNESTVSQTHLFPTQGVGYGDVIIASAVYYNDGKNRIETIIEIVRVDFTGCGRGLRKPLIILNGFHDIVHASVSSLCPTGKTVVCYTEAFNRMTNPADSLSESIGVPSATMPCPEYKMILCVVNSKCKNISLDVSVLPIDCSLKACHNMYQAGYFMRKRKDSDLLYLIQCCDFNTIHVRSVNVELQNGESKRVNISKVKEQLCSKPCWHSWDPTTQRLYFFVYQMGCYKLKILQFNGDGPSPKECFCLSRNERDTPTRMREAFQISVPPSHIPFAGGCSSLNALLQITMLPISFESGVQDTAMCYQEIQYQMPSNSQKTSHVPSERVSTLQRLMELNKELTASGTTASDYDDVNDVKSSLKDTLVTPRRDLPQSRELCVTITLLHNWLATININIKLNDIPINADITERASFTFIEGVIAIVVPGVCVHFVDVCHHEQPPKHLFGVPLTPPAQRSREVCSEAPLPQMSVGEKLLLQHKINTPIPTLPCGNGNWLFEVNGINLMKISISRSGLWEWIRDNATTAPLEDLRGACHLVTTHYHTPMKINHFVTSNVFAMLWSGVSLGPSLLAKLLTGECYGAVRDIAKQQNNSYWQLIPMYAGVGGFDVNSIRARPSFVETKSEILPQKDVLRMTIVSPEWWVTKPDNRENKFLFFKKKKPTPPTRYISLAPSIIRVCSNPRSSDSFKDSIAEILCSLEVPRDEATYLSQTYSITLKTTVESILRYNDVITEPPILPNEELQFLHNVNGALRGINYTPPAEFHSRYARLALRNAPIAAVHLGIQSQMYKPSVEDLFRRYSSLLEPAKKAARLLGYTYLPIACKGVMDRCDAFPSGLIKSPTCFIMKASEAYKFVTSHSVGSECTELWSGLVDKEFCAVQLAGDCPEVNNENQRDVIVIEDFTKPLGSRHAIYDYDEIEALLKEEGYLSSSSDNQSDDSDNSEYSDDEDDSLIYIPTSQDHLTSLTPLLINCPNIGTPTSYHMFTAAACAMSSTAVSAEERHEVDLMLDPASVIHLNTHRFPLDIMHGPEALVRSDYIPLTSFMEKTDRCIDAMDSSYRSRVLDKGKLSRDREITARVLYSAMYPMVSLVKR